MQKNNQPTVNSTINTIVSELDETEIIFAKPKMVFVQPNSHHLMNVLGVAVDAAGKLWVKNERRCWIEITDHLVHAIDILQAINDRLEEILPTKEKQSI